MSPILLGLEEVCGKNNGGTPKYLAPSICKKSSDQKMGRILLSVFSLFLILIDLEAYGQTLIVPSTTPLTTPGSGTFTVPAGVTSITVEVWGGGGKGGSRSGSNGTTAGGGGGAYSRSVLSVTPGQVIPYKVGNGSISTSPGETSWFLDSLTMKAKGGNSVPQNGTTRATGGSGPSSVGDITYGGGNGADAGSNYGGGGGSSAGIAINGIQTNNINGAIAPVGGGNGGSGFDGSGNGNPQGPGQYGFAPGGGGGGVLRGNASGTVVLGGNGGNGQLRISYIALTSAEDTDNQSVCVDDPITNITYTVPPNSTVNILTLPAGLSSSYNSPAGTISISGIPTADGSYTINVIPSYFSTISLALTTTGSVTIIPNNTVSSVEPNQTICINKPLLPEITHTTTGATGISNDGVPGANGLPPGVSASWDADEIIISGTPSSTVGSPYNYSILLTGGCGEIYATGTITVTPDNTVAPIGSPDQTKCIDEGIDVITFNTTGATGIENNGVPGANGLPPGVSASWSAGVITISGTPTSTAGSPYSYSIPLTGGCGDVFATGTITVTPNNTATPVGSANQSQCINEELVDITFNTTGATGIGAATGLPPGVIASWNAGVITISGTPTSTSGSPYNYSIPLTGGCGNISATGTILVTPDNTVLPTTPTDQTECINVGIDAITFTTTGATGISNAGVQGANGLPTGVSATWAGNTITIAGTPSESGTFNYSIPLIGGCNDLYAEGTITVNPATEITSENLANQRICDGASFAQLSVTATGTGTLAYQWYSNTDPATSGPNLEEVGNDTNAYTPLADEIATKYYYVVVSSECGDDIVSSFAQATVEPITTITTDIDTSNDVECYGDGFDLLTVVADGADLQYQWYVKPTNSDITVDPGTEFPGATSAVFTPPSTAALNEEFYYYVVVKGLCGVETSRLSGQYIVTQPATQITLQPSTDDEDVCQDGALFSELEVAAIGETDAVLFPDIKYQWYSNTSPVNTGGTILVGETTPNYRPENSTVGTLYYYATAASLCGTVPTDISGAFTVTQPSVVTSESLDAQEICIDQTFAPISIVADGTGTIEYQWYSNTIAVADTLSPGVTELTGHNAFSFPPPTTLGTLYYFVKVSSECGPNVLSSISGAFTVNPLPIPTLTSDVDADPFVCEGTTVTYTTESGQTNYIWEIPGQGTPLDYIITSGGTTSSNTISITWLTDGSKDVSVNYQDPNGCSADSPTVNSITVDPLPVPTLTSSIDLDPFICAGGSVTYTTDPGQSNYIWSFPGQGSPLDYTITSGGTSTSNTATITWLTDGPKDVTVSYADPNGCSPSTPTTNSITVDPLPDPTFTASPGSYVCEEIEEVTYTTQSGNGNYIWNIPGLAGTDYQITAGGIGNTDSSVSLIWLTTGNKTVTVSYTNPTTGCVAPTLATNTTEVSPLASVGPTSDPFPSVCISSPILSPFTQSTSGVTGIGTPTGLPPGITATFNSTTGNIEFSGTITGSSTGLYSYSIPLIGDCIDGLAATGTIDFTPNYELTSISAASATVAGGSARVFINGNPASLPNGTYLVTYILEDGTPPAEEYISNPFIVANGTGVFPTVPLIDLNVEVFKVSIKSIQRVTDSCEVPQNETDPKNIAYFSVCGATFDQNGTFTVPAGIYEITIQANGAGATGESELITIPVNPGESLGVFIGQSAGTGTARNTYVTRDSSLPNPETSSLIYANGGGASGPNGSVIISYTCPDPNKNDCIEIIDDGAKSGTTVIRFNCDYDWPVPEGLVEFSVYAIGGGGGGGMGYTGGGGGGGGFASTTINSSNPYGISQGNSLGIEVGDGGNGAETEFVRGNTGGSSTVTATITDPNGNIPVNLNAQGGGGGGSFAQLNGGIGASGGGGAFSDQTTNIMGIGGSGIANQGNVGGNGGKGNGSSTARSGGGGGGAGSNGEVGSGAGVGNSKPGAGGEGASFSLSVSTYGYGAGGGGAGFNTNSTSSEGGQGGEVNGVILGGTGIENGIGLDGTIYTGSGGGAGTYGGGNGGQGVVYITYFNYRILAVEYLYFNAKYDRENRAGELTWSTSKEWENSHFEIERAVNSVKEWETIGIVEGNGYSDVPIEYSFEDQDLPASGGNIFYRLKQVDFDGSFSYSVTKSIQVEALEGSAAWIAYPNPSDMGSTVTVALLDNSENSERTIQIMVSDVRGVYQTYTVQNPEDVSAAVNSYLENARPGLYIVQIFWGNQSQVLKLVRQ